MQILQTKQWRKNTRNTSDTTGTTSGETLNPSSQVLVGFVLLTFNPAGMNSGLKVSNTKPTKTWDELWIKGEQYEAH
jgi:hypothetical protein